MYCPRCGSELWKQERWGKIVIGYCQKCMKKTYLGDMCDISPGEFQAMQRDELNIYLREYKNFNYEDQIKKAWRAVL